MNVRDFFASLVRTVVPVIGGFIVARLATLGVDIDADALELVVDGVFVGGYYAAARWAESRWSWAGWLLGWNVPPRYDNG